MLFCFVVVVVVVVVIIIEEATLINLIFLNVELNKATTIKDNQAKSFKKNNNDKSNKHQGSFSHN